MPPEGYKMTELGELPVEWEVVSLGEYAKMIVPMRDKPKDLSGPIPWTRIEDFDGKYLYGSKSDRGVTKETIQQMNLKVYPVNTVLCSCSCSMGVCAITKNELVSNQTFIGIVAAKRLFYEFLYFLMSSYSNNLKKMSTGTTIDYLSRQKFENLQIPLPSLPEQQRIAEILSTVDETIEHTEALIEKYRNIKKGLMTDLLTRGIDEDGRIRSEDTHRFRDSPLGRIPEEWKVKEIIEACEKPQYGYTQSATDKSTGLKFLRITDIQNGVVDWEKVPYCNCAVGDIDKYLLKSCDVLFARTGATTGKSYIIRDCPKAIFASYLIRIKPKNDTDSNFLFMFFNSSLYWKQINEKIVGSAQGGLNATVLSELKLPFPSLPEQQRIAEILTASNERIEKEDAYREKLLQLKKGLMQELLTGRVRVKVPQEVVA